MTKWYVKELSKLTKVSVQTLHHYDRIGLLKPSFRQINGYRLYNQDDLLRLQQIIALKFLGFELSHIKELVEGRASAAQHFKMQSDVLEQKAKKLLDASQALRAITNDVDDKKSISWEKIIQLIEVYRMTQELEQSWLKEIFNHDELKQYATFEAELKSNATPDQKEAFEKSWNALVEELRAHLNHDPASPIGISLGKKCMDWVNRVYGKKYAHLRTKKFEKGYAEGKGLDEVGLTPDVVAWMDKAMDAYWRDRIYGTLNQIGKVSHQTLLKEWNAILDDMYGDDHVRAKELYAAAMTDDHICDQAKEWLKTIQN